MDTRRISPAMRRRVGQPASNYVKATPTGSGQGADVVGNRSAGHTPTLGENRDYYSGDRTGIVRNMPMSSDYRVIERAFADKRVQAELRRSHTGSEGGWGEG